MTHQTTPSPAGPAPALRRNFDLHDANRDGRLTLGEFMRLIGSSEVELSADECQTAFDEMDTDHDGLIEFAQFKVWWNERLIPPDSE